MRKILSILFFFLVASSLFAHPHLFAGVDLTFDFSKQDSLRITEKWMFDDMTSLLILEDYDLDGDEEFSSEESNALGRSVLPGLSEYNYYNDLTIDNQDIIITKIDSFAVKTSDIFVYYQFEIVVPFKDSLEENKINISVYDKEFYTKFFMNVHKGVFFEGADNYDIDIKAEENKSKTFYYGQVNPVELKLNVRRK